MPGPLVQHAQIREAAQHGHAVLGEHCHAELIHQIGNAVIGRRVHMVGAAGEDDAHEMLFLDLFQDAAGLVEEIGLVFFHFSPGRRECLEDIAVGDMERSQLFHKAFLQCARFIERQERMEERNARFLEQVVHIGGDGLRIGGHHGAHVGIFIFLIRPVVDAGVPDEIGLAPDEVGDVRVDQLHRIAFRIGRDRFQRRDGDLADVRTGEDDAEAQLREEGEPEGIFLIHIERPGDAHGAAGRLARGERPVGEEPVIFPLIDIGQGGAGRCLAGEGEGSAPFAAVARYEGAAVGEGGHRDEAVVAAAGAAVHIGLHGDLFQFLRRDEGGAVGLGAAVLRDEGHAVRAHEAGDIRAHHVPAEELFQRAEHCVIVEGAALNDHLVAQLGHIAEAHHFIEGVLDDGVGQAGGNIRDGDAVFLGLPHAGIHEDRAAGAQVHRMGRREGDLREGADVHAEGLREGVEEGAAAGRAGFVEEDAVHGAVLQAAAFHILTADIEDGGHVRAEMARRPVVGHGLHLAGIGGECFAEQIFPVAGDAGPADTGACGELAVQIGNDGLGAVEGIAPVVSVVFIEDAALCIEEHRLDGGGTGIDAEPAGAGGLGQRKAVHMEARMPGLESFVFLVRSEERFQTFHRVQIGHVSLADAFQPGIEVKGLVVHGGERRPDGDVELAVLRHDHILLFHAEGHAEPFPEDRLEGERAAEEYDLSAERTAAGEAGNGLIDHRLEDRGRDILLRGAFVEQGLNVRLGENAAPGGNGIDLLRFGGQPAEACRIGGKKSRHAVDEGARPAGAGAVHALIHAVFQVGHLFILAAQLDDGVRFGIEGAYGLSLREDLLIEGQLHEAGQTHAAASGNGRGDPVPGEGFLHFLQQIHGGLADVRHMPHIPAEKKLQVGREHCDFDGGRTDIYANVKNGLHIKPPYCACAQFSVILYVYYTNK